MHFPAKRGSHANCSSTVAKKKVKLFLLLLGICRCKTKSRRCKIYSDALLSPTFSYPYIFLKIRAPPIFLFSHANFFGGGPSSPSPSPKEQAWDLSEVPIFTAHFFQHCVTFFSSSTPILYHREKGSNKEVKEGSQNCPSSLPSYQY